MIGGAWQPAARICTASLGPLRDRLWAGQRQGRIPSAISGKAFNQPYLAEDFLSDKSAMCRNNHVGKSENYKQPLYQHFQLMHCINNASKVVVVVFSLSTGHLFLTTQSIPILPIISITREAWLADK